MRIAVLYERRAGERRVAVTPEATGALVVDGHSVVVEAGAESDHRLRSMRTWGERCRPEGDAVRRWLSG